MGMVKTRSRPSVSAKKIQKLVTS